ncbi:hypothetical protein [Caballeronia novacaledonica]|uniref:Uncharacterized protein n=1 Tax=Caballeronia novacaledonica TaxID=1544861 RepID=A0AA37MN35_9BURK|nr:hypothetical protein [Caballeronia novacaledonica]GJH23701.1 hypothetical protein CBA19CS42_04315 [Caballeronia novacaledonica]
MKNWYAGITKQQKLMVWGLAGLIALVMAAESLTMTGFVVGFIPLAVLTYLQLGTKKPESNGQA